MPRWTSAAKQSRKHEKTEMTIAVQEVGRRMEEFTQAVDALNTLRGSLTDFEEELHEKEEEYSKRIEDMRKAYEERKMDAIRSMLAEDGRVVLSGGAHQDLLAQIADAKAELTASKNRHNDDLEAAVTAKMQAVSLEHDHKVASLEAKVTAQKQMHEAEVAALKDAIARLTEELASQKQLTGQLAGGIRQPVVAASANPV